MRELDQRSYHVAFLTTKFTSLDAVRLEAPGALEEHIARTRELHNDGLLLMAGAFLDSGTDEPISTMAVLVSRGAAEEFVAGDPFVQRGLIAESHIREWANMLRPTP